MHAINAMLDHSADWAYSALVDWGVRFADRRTTLRAAFYAAGRRTCSAAPVLLETAQCGQYRHAARLRDYPAVVCSRSGLCLPSRS